MNRVLKQEAFDFDLRKRDPVVHQHEADFTAMTLGHMVGDECRVIRCPCCSRPCIGQERARSWRFIHNANIQSTTRRTRFEPVVYCSLDHEEIKVLRDRGVIVANRLGQILEVR